MSFLEKADTAVFYAINRSGTPFLDPLMVGLSDGKTWWALGIAVTLLLVIRPRKELWMTWFLVLLALGISDGFTYWVLKDYFERPRPCYTLEGIRFILPTCGARWGFPSNHAANGMAIATMAYLRLRSPWTKGIFLIAGIVGLSRIYLGVHYPLDILAGFLTGTLVSALLYHLVRLAPRLFASQKRLQSTA